MDLQHHGIARLSIEGDLAAGQLYIPRATHLLQGLLDRMKVGGLSTGAAALRLDDNAYAYARVAGSINAVRIVVGSSGEVVQERRVTLGAPDFVSGVVTNGRIKTRTVYGNDGSSTQMSYVAAFYPTAQTTQTHSDLLPNQVQGVERLAVLPHESHSEWESKTPSIVNSQYRQCRSTLYSGRMKRVVQALMGFGKQMPTQAGYGSPITDPEDGAINPSRTTSIYASVFSALAKDAPKRRPTTYERDVARNGLQIRYDYRFMRTHGIHVAADGELWLVEIGMTRGILAMPLPVHELTRRPARPEPGHQQERWRFREALEKLSVKTASGQMRDVQDVDGITVLEEFGGFPTGEGFPEGELLQTAIRAGEVLQLQPVEALDAFYRHSYYSSSMGWAFSESGKEAHNTGFRFEDSPVGHQIGVHYSINMTIGAMTSTTGAHGASGIAERVQRAQGVDGDKRAILARKALRLTESQIRDLTQNELTDDDLVSQLDALQGAPIATGTAALRLQRESYMVNPGKFPSYQIKFHEPLFGFLLSHDFKPANGDPIPPPRKSDATMHVFFDGEEFKWVRYFYDPQQSPSKVEDDRDNCMYVGSWSLTTITGPLQVSRGFYTSDFDERKMLGEAETKMLIKGSYVGATSVKVADDPADFRRNYGIRTHSFLIERDTTTKTGQQVLTGIAVPFGMREAYYFAVMDYMESYTRTRSRAYDTLTDPYMVEGWRCIISTAGFAYWPDDMKQCPPGCDTRINRAGYQGSMGDNPRVARYVTYNPYLCSDFADKGAWVKKCDNLDAKKYNIAPPSFPTQSEYTPRKATLNVRLVMGIGPRSITTNILNYQDADWVMPRWFRPSPDEFGTVDFIAAGGSALGDSEAAVVDRDLNFQGGVARYGASTYDGMDGSVACYIGVV